MTGPVLIVFAVIVLIVLIVAIVVARRVYKRIRTSPALADAVLRVRAEYTGGPRQEVLQLRIKLREALDSGQAAIDAAFRSAVPQGELAGLFGRIQREGVALEGQLRLMESEYDPAVVAKAVPTARDRVNEVASLVRRVRTAVASDMGQLTDSTLTDLRTDVEQEVTALRAGVQALQQLNGSSPTGTS